MLDFNSFFKDLSSLVKYKSVRSHATPNAPFGEQTGLCLKEFMQIAKNLGFNPIDHGGYMVEIAVGEGEQVGVIGHLDVVPEGEVSAWNTPPYTLTLKDGKLFGRGVEDDKGPLLLCLYALKSVVDSGIKFNKQIRFFAGTDEETSWQDVEYFSKVSSFPEYGFSPDGAFPLSYAEKGVMPTTFFLPKPKLFENIQGGKVVNAVCDYAFATPNFTPDQKDLEKFGLTFKDGKIISYGVTAHGSTPHLGKNAIKPLLEYALFVGEDLKNLLDCLFYDAYGVGNMENEQGKVTLSPNLIKTTTDGLHIVCDVRIPYPFTQNDVKSVFEKFGIPFEYDCKHPPVCTQKDGWFVQSLLGAYKQVTGDLTAQPISLGGSTFARAFKFGCSFGPELNGNSSAHKSNEWVDVDTLNQCFQIYKNAFINLVK